MRVLIIFIACGVLLVVVLYSIELIIRLFGIESTKTNIEIARCIFFGLVAVIMVLSNWVSKKKHED